MELCVGFWDEEKNSINARYLISKFLGHSSACDILYAFLDGMKVLNLSNKAQLLMDGSATNLKFSESLKSYRSEWELPKLINIGTCGLYIIHGAFKFRTEATN